MNQSVFIPCLNTWRLLSWLKPVSGVHNHRTFLDGWCYESNGMHTNTDKMSMHLLYKAVPSLLLGTMIFVIINKQSFSFSYEQFYIRPSGSNFFGNFIQWACPSNIVRYLLKKFFGKFTDLLKCLSVCRYLNLLNFIVSLFQTKFRMSYSISWVTSKHFGALWAILPSIYSSVYFLLFVILPFYSITS